MKMGKKFGKSGGGKGGKMSSKLIATPSNVEALGKKGAKKGM